MIDLTKETLLAARDVAKMLKCTEHSVFTLFRQGKLESIKIGGLRRTSLEAIQRFAERTEQGFGGEARNE